MRVAARKSERRRTDGSRQDKKRNGATHGDLRSMRSRYLWSRGLTRCRRGGAAVKLGTVRKKSRFIEPKALVRKAYLRPAHLSRPRRPAIDSQMVCAS